MSNNAINKYNKAFLNEDSVPAHHKLLTRAPFFIEIRL
jgi:hypothetical protein